MVLLEFCPPLQWKPYVSRLPEGWRFMWGWIAVAYVPYGFNEYGEGMARAGARLYLEGKLKL